MLKNNEENLKLEEYFDTRRSFVDKGLKKFLEPSNQYPEQLHKAMNYSVFSGGKRLRPILFFAAYETLKQALNIRSLTKVQPAACALELVHTASLIHDDLPSMDNSDMRRNYPTCHKEFGVPTAILAGDALITKAFELLTIIRDSQKAVRSVEILAKAISTRGMIGGQTVDVLTTSGKARSNVLRYIHLKKTGSLLQASMSLACELADADDNVRVTLDNYALNVGLAYQIIDDILDEIGTSDVLGRDPGEDLRNDKTTYSGMFGLDGAKKKAEKILDDTYKSIKTIPNNDILVDYINYVKDRMPI